MGTTGVLWDLKFLPAKKATVMPLSASRYPGHSSYALNSRPLNYRVLFFMAIDHPGWVLFSAVIKVSNVSKLWVPINIWPVLLLPR